VHKIQFRVWLPFALSLISSIFMAWGLYAQWQCRFEDAVRPFWRCQAPDFAIELLNAPPVVLSRPLANSWPTRPIYFGYVVELPLVFLWWWFVGTRLDFGLLGLGQYRHRRAWLSLLVASIALLLALFGWSQLDDIRFYQQYSYLHENPYLASIKNLRLLPSRLWLLVLIFGLGLAVLRIARGRIGQSDRKLASPRTVRLVCLGLGLYCLGVGSAVWHTKLVERQRQAEYDLHRIIIRGRVLDNSGTPIFAIKVDLVPVLHGGAVPDEENASDFTNENGEYELSPEQPGRYILSVQWNAPPSTEDPFLTRYYPDADDLKQAETLEIVPARHLTLSPIRLQRLALVKVPVAVYWSNGRAEPEAYLFFRNTLYPKYGAIGRETLNPGSDGTVSIPVGFEYLANAQVNCDEGQSIGNAYTPELALSLKSANPHPKPLRFVLPGNPCLVWHPK